MKKYILILFAILGAVSCAGDHLDAIENRLDTLEGVTIESLKAKITQVMDNISSCEEACGKTELFYNQLKARLESLEGSRYESLSASVSALGTRISAFESDLAKIRADIESQTSDVLQWAGNMTSTAAAMKTLADDVTALENSLGNAASRLSVIEGAYNLDIDALFKDADALLASCKSGLIAAKASLESLDGAADAIISELDTLLSRINSVVHVPLYYDSHEEIGSMGVTTSLFEIYPTDIMDAVAAVPSAFSIDAYVVSADGTGETVNLPIKGINTDTGFLELTFSASSITYRMDHGDKAYAHLTISEGETSISSDSFELKYTNIPLQDMSLNMHYINVLKGGTRHLSAVLTPANASGVTLNWSSSDPSVATVSQDGLVTGISTGDAMIRVTASTENFVINDACEVHVYTDYSLSYNLIPLDLGLSVKWAIGVLRVNDNCYFAWGETSPKPDVVQYGWDNYLYVNYEEGKSKTDEYEGIQLTKYNETDGLKRLLPEDDAATFHLGTAWRTPTRAEFKELFDNVTHSYDTNYRGLRFDYANGFFYLPSLNHQGNILDYSSGLFWTSEIMCEGNSFTYPRGGAILTSDLGNLLDGTSLPRNYGLCIFPVCTLKNEF